MGDEEFQEMQRIVEMGGLLPSDLYGQLFRAFTAPLSRNDLKNFSFISVEKNMRKRGL